MATREDHHDEATTIHEFALRSGRVRIELPVLSLDDIEACWRVLNALRALLVAEAEARGEIHEDGRHCFDEDVIRGAKARLLARQKEQGQKAKTPRPMTARGDAASEPSSPAKKKPARVVPRPKSEPPLCNGCQYRRVTTWGSDGKWRRTCSPECHLLTQQRSAEKARLARAEKRASHARAATA